MTDPTTKKRTRKPKLDEDKLAQLANLAISSATGALYVMRNHSLEMIPFLYKGEPVCLYCRVDGDTLRPLAIAFTESMMADIKDLDGKAVAWEESVAQPVH